MKQSLTNAAAKLSRALASLPIQFAHLRGIVRGPRPPARLTSESNREAPPAEEDGASEMYGASLAACARRRERARCAAIVLSDAGQRNPAMAKVLAFQTRMSRSEAVQELSMIPAVARVQTSRPQGYWVGRQWDPKDAMFAGREAAPARSQKRSTPVSRSRG